MGQQPADQPAHRPLLRTDLRRQQSGASCRNPACAHAIRDERTDHHNGAQTHAPRECFHSDWPHPNGEHSGARKLAAGRAQRTSGYGNLNADLARVALALVALALG